MSGGYSLSYRQYPSSFYTDQAADADFAGNSQGPWSSGFEISLYTEDDNDADDTAGRLATT